MVLREFDFTYTQRGRQFKASCTVMDALHFPGNIMYRVVTKDKLEHVHIFYKLDNPKRMFYWFPLQDRQELIAKSIADALEKTVVSLA